MRVSYQDLKNSFYTNLTGVGFSESKAEACAGIFAGNSRDGVYSHGLNRFPVFMQMIKEGLVDPAAEPALVNSVGLMEVWEGNRGAGMYNATLCMDRAIVLAKEHGIGCVSIRNTNHWMRGGTYGWQAAENGCIGICFTNAIATMSPWGGNATRLGNNPLVIAVPRNNGPVVLDMAMSQYSYGKMQEYEMDHKQLPFAGGYDEKGELTHDPATIRRTKRALPIGFWKGSGLAMILDMVLVSLTGGRSVAKITAEGKEAGVSQRFIALHHPDLHAQMIEEILAYTKEGQEGYVAYPGENTLKTRLQNEKEGIPVNEEIWNSLNK